MSHSKLISLNNILLLVVGCTIGLFSMILSIGFDDNSILLIINSVLISSVLLLLPEIIKIGNYAFFGEGQIAQLSFGFNNFYRNTYSIWGSEGHVTVARAFSIPTTYKPKIILEKQDDYEEIVCDHDDHFFNEINYYCRGIGKKNIYKTWYGDIKAQSKLIERVLCA